jgi:FKBP-type peptidyl-prolyl cis-trans isomerase
MKKILTQIIIVVAISLLFIFIYQTSSKDKTISYIDEDINFIGESQNSQESENNTGAVNNTNNTNNMENQITELKIETIKEGTGEGAVNGNTVTVHYTGTLLDGTKFDSSLDRGTPFSFELGAGQVIQGWEQGILGMKVGEKRKLTIPSDLAYGANGAGGVIGPNEALIFDVELLEIN